MRVLLIVFFLLRGTKALVKCNETVSKLQLCSLTKKYNKGVPPRCVGCEPMKLETKVTVFKIAELDEEMNSITFNLLISAIWNDTRVTLETNDPNE